MAAVLVAVASAAGAHAPARLRVASPDEDARVVGGSVRVVVVGEGGDSPSTFRMELDGRAVDATGKVGGVFTTLSVRPGTQMAVEVAVSPGDHTLTITPTFDPDATQEAVVRRFTVVAEQQGSPVVVVALAGIVLAGAVGAAVLARRKAAQAGT